MRGSLTYRSVVLLAGAAFGRVPHLLVKLLLLLPPIRHGGQITVAILVYWCHRIGSPVALDLAIIAGGGTPNEVDVTVPTGLRR